MGVLEDAAGKPAPEGNTAPVLAVALLLVVIIAGVAGVVGKFPSHGLGLTQVLSTVAGGAIVIAGVSTVLIWPVLYLGFLKNENPYAGPKYFLILVMTSLLAYGTTAAVPVTFAYRAEKLQAKFDVVSMAYHRQLAADVRAYNEERRAKGLIDLFTPEALARDDQRLTALNRKLGQAWTLMIKYRALPAQRLTEAHKQLEAAIGGEGESKRAIEAFDALYKNADQRRARTWELNERMLTEIDETVADLERARGHWRVGRGIFEFERDADLTAFQRHVAAMNSTIRETNRLAQSAY
jgi:hypothetical protein